MTDEQLEKRELEKDSHESHFNGLPLLLGFLALVILPAGILASIIYLILFKLIKWTPQFNSAILGTLFLLVGIIGFPLNAYDIQNTTMFYSFICILLGIILGWGFILWRAYQLKKNPELKVLKGWAKNYEYRKSPLRIKKKEALIEEISNGEHLSYEYAALGVLDEPIMLNNNKTYDKETVVSRYYDEAVKSTMIFGATGSGKTITMTSLMYNDVIAGYPICVIDFKKGVELVYHLSKWAKENGREFYHFTSGAVGTYNNPYCSELASYDPLATGTATSKADMMLNLRKWDGASDVYKGRTQAILQAIFFLLERIEKNNAKHEIQGIPWNQGGIAIFTAALQTPNLFDMIQWFERYITLNPKATNSQRKQLEELKDLHNILTSKNNPLKEQIEGLSIICKNLTLSSYSDWLAKGNSKKHIDLAKIAMSKEAPIVLFQFNPLEEKDFAQYMGNIIMSDLSRASAIKNEKGDTNLFGLYIDEFQTLSPETVSGIAEKARSARFYTTMSLQSAEQIAKVSERNGEETLNAFFDTVGNFIIHQGSSYDSAERLSKIIGKTEKTIYKATGKRQSNFLSNNFKNERNSMVNESLEDVYRLDPKKLMELSQPTRENGYTSTAYYITKACTDPELSQYSYAIARKVHIIPYEEVLDPVPESFRRNLFKGKAKKKRRPEQKEPEQKEQPIRRKVPRTVVPQEEAQEKITRKSTPVSTPQNRRPGTDSYPRRQESKLNEENKINRNNLKRPMRETHNSVKQNSMPLIDFNDDNFHIEEIPEENNSDMFVAKVNNNRTESNRSKLLKDKWN